ncbi:MAG TPA: PVC-type heme-binding CxxCH protein [Pirellulaceae bacterium]|nr:PVC-type heme-binding CxxCH protein [Pirellulaceae bacterium]
MRPIRILIALALSAAGLLPTGPALAQNPFAAIVRTTDPLSPKEQLEKFHLPPGFEIQLFAAEPGIQKPMNLAFDGRGRLWVSGSVEYPFVADPGYGRDSIRILEDTTGDGRADRITTFADGLNIPIGLYPYRDGVVVYSVPNIYFLRDTDGDGHADRREILYGPLDAPVDTHGMQNAFRRGFDGWLYINHGFRNDTTIAGSDGSKITLNSGNTYRVRLDGSRVEQYTWGQVNPFGSTFTPGGDLITADCHSKPLTLLLRGAHYSSFNKPHDGLGFAPNMTEHSHGSTAIAGAAYCDGAFPVAWQGSLLVANVMTCRVHRDTLVLHGSSVEAHEQPDLLVSDDPWFRPVDLRFGPDGALYVADFYNRIIGHYEVPLDHLQRDRTRGRIWRVVYRGAGQDHPQQFANVDLTTASTDELIAVLASPSMDQRMLATDQLTDRIGPPAIDPLRQMLQDAPNVPARVHTMWALYRLKALKLAEVERLAHAPEATVRRHAMRALAETAVTSTQSRDLAIAALRDVDPAVRRAAADAIGQHPTTESIGPLLRALEEAATDDVQLRHTIRLAIRNQLRAPLRDGDNPFAMLEGLNLDPAGHELMASIAQSIHTEQAATYIVDRLQTQVPAVDVMLARLKHAASYASETLIDRIVPLVRKHAKDDVDLQKQLLQTLQQQRSQRGLPPTDSLRDWGTTLAAELLKSLDSEANTWGVARGGNLWGFEERNSADRRQATRFLSSLPGGERGTSVLRSVPFEIPPQLSFFICGHRGFPDKPPLDANFVVIRLAETGRIAGHAFPPRHDVAQPVVWDLSEYQGQRGYLEIVDGLNLSAYAWLAVARFEPDVVPLTMASPRTIAQRQIAAAAIAQALKLSHLADPLRRIVRAETTGAEARSAAVAAIVTLEPNPVAAAFVPILGEAGVNPPLQLTIADAIVDRDSAKLDEFVQQTMKTSPMRVQQKLADGLAASPVGSGVLLDLIERGIASARLLQSASLRQKLLATDRPTMALRIEQLTANLPAASEQLDSILKQRHTSFLAAAASAERGQLQFTKHCAVCHQVQGQGAVVGPQLDGVGNRGLERILEDVLDPNRNLDAAFHVSLLATSDGRVLTGLFRRKEGKSLIFAANDGKEFSVLEADIDEHRKSPLSIMPDNMSTVLPPADFSDLVKYLLSLRQPAKKTASKPEP